MTMPSKAQRFVPFYASIIAIAFCLGCNQATAWQNTMVTMTRTKSSRPPTRMFGSPNGHQYPSDDGSDIEILPSARRRLLFGIAKTAAGAATAAVLPPRAPCNAAEAAAGMTADAARGQWKEAVTALDDLLQNWATVSEGDAGPNGIRSRLGFLGATSSPLFKVEKVFKALRDSEYVEDGIEFFETAEDFVTVLVRADSLADSANLKTGSGKQTPPEVFIENARKEVVEMQRIAKNLNAMVK